MPNTVMDLDVRPDLQHAQFAFVDGLGAPGTWWTGAERVSIAKEVRRAREKAHLPPWHTPSSINPSDNEEPVLPGAAVDAVWRLTNHPGTLTDSWYQGIVEIITPHHYVEMVGIVAGLNAIDRFADALGLERLLLPDPQPGEPSMETVEAVVTTHWVPTADIPGGNVLKAMSAVPTAWQTTRPIAETHYVPQEMLLGDLAWNRGTLSRPQIEFVAAVTSFGNECFY
jgi:hypothetical protein